jgi:hypothetical protein
MRDPNPDQTSELETQLETNRKKAEAMLQSRVMPAFTQLSDELHRPEQNQVVTIEPTSSTSAELTLSGRQTDVGHGSAEAVPLRYRLKIAFDPRAIVVRRTVNGKERGFLGQTNFASLSQQTIVDDVRREWRRAQNP